MPFTVPIQIAQSTYPDYKFIRALTPSEQKAAFHVQDSTGHDYCFKIIAPNYSVDRLEREIQALQTIQHPNVVQLVQYTFSARHGQQQHYMVEEFIEGNDLSAHLQAGIAWPRQRISELFAAVCDGLAALRSADIVHRDLKPGNIRLRPNGSPVIIDFGLARMLTLPAITQTQEGAAIGTPVYFAPEQFVGTKYDIDHRTDLFAVGLLIYEALIGRLPFYSANMTYQELSDAVCTSNDCFNHAGFVALPAEWKLLLRRLLEKSRAKRPATAEQVGIILRKIGGI